MRTAAIWTATLAALALIGGACAGAGDRAEEAASTRTEQPAAPQGLAARDAAPAAPAPALAGGQQAANAQAGSGAQAISERKVIVNVALDILVGDSDDVQNAFARVSQVAEANGGLVAESSVRQEGGQRRATITIRVPTNRYQAALDEVRGLGSVESERSSANDVTEEYTDLGSRQRNLEATEQQLLVFLGQAKSVQEVLTVQDRLNVVRAEIEKVKGRIALLGRLTDLATIQVQLRPDAAPVTRAEPDGGALAALARGWEASLDVVGAVGAALLTAAAFSWWLLPLAAAGIWFVRREARRRALRPGAADGAGT